MEMEMNMQWQLARQDEAGMDNLLASRHRSADEYQMFSSAQNYQRLAFRLQKV